MNPWDYLVHGSMLIFASAFLARDVMLLRGLAIVGFSLELPYFYFAHPQPIWLFIGWNTVFIAANCFGIALLRKERSMDFLSSEERELYHKAFRGFSPTAFLKIVHAGEACSLSAGEQITVQGEPVSHLCLVCEGAVTVRIDEKEVGRLKVGQLIGEMSFLTEEPATATVLAAESTRILRWSQKDLRMLLQRNQNLNVAMQELLNTDLVRKLGRQE